MTASRATSRALCRVVLLAPAMAAVTAIAITACAKPAFTVKPPGPPVEIDPADSPECTGKDLVSFLAGHMDDMQACTANLGCRKDHVRTVTLLVGCNGPGGALMVISHPDLKEYNQCMAERAAAWDYSSLCTTDEGECAWTVAVEIECKMQ